MHSWIPKIWNQGLGAQISLSTHTSAAEMAVSGLRSKPNGDSLKGLEFMIVIASRFE
jgi:hypothetical protein